MRVNPAVFRDDYLKKQSQFAGGQNGVKSMLIMVYGDFDGSRLRKNKPNSKPIKANFKTDATPKGVEQRPEAGLRLMTEKSRSGDL